MAYTPTKSKTLKESSYANIRSALGSKETYTVTGSGGTATVTPKESSSYPEVIAERERLIKEAAAEGSKLTEQQEKELTTLPKEETTTPETNKEPPNYNFGNTTAATINISPAFLKKYVTEVLQQSQREDIAQPKMRVVTTKPKYNQDNQLPVSQYKKPPQTTNEENKVMLGYSQKIAETASKTLAYGITDIQQGKTALAIGEATIAGLEFASLIPSSIGESFLYLTKPQKRSEYSAVNEYGEPSQAAQDLEAAKLNLILLGMGMTSTTSFSTNIKQNAIPNSIIKKFNINEKTSPINIKGIYEEPTTNYFYKKGELITITPKAETIRTKGITTDLISSERPSKEIIVGQSIKPEVKSTIGFIQTDNTQLTLQTKKGIIKDYYALSKTNYEGTTTTEYLVKNKLTGKIKSVGIKEYESKNSILYFTEPTETLMSREETSLPYYGKETTTTLTQQKAVSGLKGNTIAKGELAEARTTSITAQTERSPLDIFASDFYQKKEGTISPEKLGLDMPEVRYEFQDKTTTTKQLFSINTNEVTIENPTLNKISYVTNEGKTGIITFEKKPENPLMIIRSITLPEEKPAIQIKKILLPEGEPSQKITLKIGGEKNKESGMIRINEQKETPKGSRYSAEALREKYNPLTAETETTFKKVSIQRPTTINEPTIITLPETPIIERKITPLFNTNINTQLRSNTKPLQNNNLEQNSLERTTTGIINIVNPKIAERQEQAQRQTQKQSSATDLSTNINLQTKPLIETVTRQEQAQRQEQEQKQQPEMKQEQIITQSNIFKTITRPQLPQPPQPPPKIFIPLIPKLPISIKEKGIFSVEVRKKGVFQIIGTRSTEEEALNLAESRVKNTASASFRILEDKTPITDLRIESSFYPSKKERGVFIQRREKRISTPGEKREITYQGIMSNKIKNKKSKKVFGGKSWLKP